MLQSSGKAAGTRSLSTNHACFESLQQAVRARQIRYRALSFSVQTVILGMLAAMLLFRAPQVSGRSMLPQIADGNHVLINTAAYGLSVEGLRVGDRPISRWDIVAFVQRSGDDRNVFLKRVIAFSGERVAISDGRVSVNNELLTGPYSALLDHSNLAPMVVPAQSVFVLGDNRSESDDSRSFGPVALQSIIGKAFLVIWPLDRVKTLR